MTPRYRQLFCWQEPDPKTVVWSRATFFGVGLSALLRGSDYPGRGGEVTPPQAPVSWIAFFSWFYNNTGMHLERITIKPDVCGGEPTIRGMRITVSHVLEMLAGDMTPGEILEDFPYLEKADIEACLDYAARQAAHREVLLSK